MNSGRHNQAFSDQILAVAKDAASEHDAHNRFYYEYRAVMEMNAEFYRSTVRRIFKNRKIAHNYFSVAGTLGDFTDINNVVIKTVEGAKDDISALGQWIAALDLYTGLPETMKASHVKPDAGRCGIFTDKSWRNNIRPLVLGFIDNNHSPKPSPPYPASQV